MCTKSTTYIHTFRHNTVVRSLMTYTRSLCREMLARQKPHQKQLKRTRVRVPAPNRRVYTASHSRATRWHANTQPACTNFDSIKLCTFFRSTGGAQSMCARPTVCCLFQCVCQHVPNACCQSREGHNISTAVESSDAEFSEMDCYWFYDVE